MKKPIDKKLLIEVFKEWVTSRMASYQEPTREGTPKGSPIGFSQNKYYAANLMALYNRGLFSLAELSREAGTSHALIRKWRTEQEFKKIAQESFNAFMEFITTHVLECMDNWTPHCERYLAVLKISLVYYLLFKAKLIHKFHENFDTDKSQLLKWLELFTAIDFSFDNLNEPSPFDIDITTLFIEWLLTFIIQNPSIEAQEKQCILLILKQLSPDGFNEVILKAFPKE